MKRTSMKGYARLACAGSSPDEPRILMEKVTLTINGLEVVADKQETILQTALRAGIYIPHLCYHPDLKPSGVCRLCMVEVDGIVAISCQTMVEQAMVIETRSPRVDEVVRANVEILVANHHLSCRGCPASGPCALQKIMASIRMDRKRLRSLRTPQTELPRDHSNPFFDYDPNKCVLCGICVRTCEKTQGALHVMNRGYSTRIAFLGDPSRCGSCEECVARCPVGAMIRKKKEETPRAHPRQL